MLFLPSHLTIMSIARLAWRRPAAMLLMLAACAFVTAVHAQQDESTEDDFKAGPTAGQRAFASTCAGCHGLDGRGSDKAPNIASSAKLQHLTNAQLSSIVSDGVPGTGMPAFRSIGSEQIRKVVAYLRTLQGQAAGRALPGSAAEGKKVFFGKGECSTCHTISGEGGFLGPDLSTYGSALSSEAILKALVAPTRNILPGYKLAVVTTGDGSRVEGVVRNEDNFSVQLQTRDAAFMFFQKSDLRSLEYSGKPLMPTNYGERLTHGEIDDLISYLMSTSSSAQAAQASPKH
jgi:cytochrome c oxidase cbb3-type subunit 3